MTAASLREMGREAAGTRGGGRGKQKRGVGRRRFLGQGRLGLVATADPTPFLSI